MPRRNQVEEQFHIQFIDWCFANAGRWPDASIEVPRRIRAGRGTIEVRAKTLAFFHPPNGGARDAVTGSIMHKMGVRRGVFDLWLPVPNKKYIGLALELKAPQKYMSKEQKNWSNFLELMGWRVEVCRSLAECIDVTTTYLNSREKCGIVKD
ncbi:MAG: hypothetical protein GY841_15755 [FCB group bacterium]|nr:hypothetical protein [FCB group bacterium]